MNDIKRIMLGVILLLISVVAITSCTEDESNFCEVTVVSGEGGTAIIYPNNSIHKIVLGWWVELTATPEKDYRFVNWTVNGKEVSRDNPYKATPYTSTQFKANFEKDNFTVKVLSSEGGTAKASQEGEVLNGTKVTLTATPNEGYSFLNWTVDGNFFSSKNPCTPTITKDIAIKANFKALHNGHEYVNLGLPSGIKWATCNVGATNPEDSGWYFAWGETKPKSTYDWTTYKYCNGDGYSMTKYCTDSYYGTVDNKTTLELSDDAARVNWGGNWRMPTIAEQDELRNTSNCTWTWTTQNGVKGYKVTSKKNGNSIFLPAAGYRYYDRLYSAGSYGFYWSSSLNFGGSDFAYSLYFYSLGDNTRVNFRCDGQSVRPVCE